MSSNERGSAAVESGGLVSSEELQQLKRGEITVDEYLDRRADRAVEKLARLVSEEEHRFLWQLARDALTTDPALVRYVRRLTGHDPSPGV